jgi:hypothetical protein
VTGQPTHTACSVISRSPSVEWAERSAPGTLVASLSSNSNRVRFIESPIPSSTRRRVVLICTVEVTQVHRQGPGPGVKDAAVICLQIEGPTFWGSPRKHSEVPSKPEFTPAVVPRPAPG